jgi:hypothetical protein
MYMAQYIIPDEEPQTTQRQVVTETTQVTPTGEPVVVSTTPAPAYQTKKAIFRAYQVVWYILGLIEVILAFRVLLRFIGANPNSGFVALIYGISAPFALPFRGIVRASSAGTSVLEWTTLIAMLVYVIIAWGIVKLFQFAKPADPVEVETTVDTQV